VRADNDINVIGAKVQSQGSVLLDAKNDLNIQATQTGHQENLAWSGLHMEASRDDLHTDLVGSTIRGAGNVTLQAGHDLSVEASAVQAGQDATLRLEAGNALNVRSGLTQDASQTSHDYKSGINYYALDATGEQTRLAATTLSGGRVELQSGADTTLAAVQINADSLDIKTAGKLVLASVTTSTSLEKHENTGDAWAVSSEGEGSQDEQLNYTQLNVGALSVQAKGGIQAQVGSQVELTTLAQQPGMQWVDQLMNDPALTGQVDWQRVEEVHEQWRYEQFGLGPASAALIAVMAGVALAPAATAAGAAVGNAAAVAAGQGVALSGATAGAGGAFLTGSGLAISSVVGGAVQAGILALGTQASVSMANNNGDLGKVLDELGSSQGVRNLATAIITGGVLAGMGMPATGLSPVGSGAQQTFGLLQSNLQAQLAAALIDSAINGTDLQDSLQQALISAVINTVGAKVANEIGGHLDGAMNKVAHAIAGCALGAAKAGDKGGCAPGAIGAVVGELMAEAISNSPGMKSYLGTDNNTVYVSGLFAGLAGAVAGGDQEAVAIANWAGSNAAANNYLAHDEREALKKAQAACYGAGSQSACDTASALQYKDEMTDRLLANAAASCSGSECNEVMSYVDKALNSLGCSIPSACSDEQTLLQYRRVAQEKAQGLEAVYPEGWLLDAKAALDLAKLGIKVTANGGGKGTLTALDKWASTSVDDLRKAKIEINARRDDAAQYDHFRNTPADAWDWQAHAPNGGAVPGSARIDTVKIGETLDRYGKRDGAYMSPASTPFAQRSLPPGKLADPYEKYTVLKPFSVTSEKIAPAFNQTGGGVQLRAMIPEVQNRYATVDDLIFFDYIKP